MPELPSGTVTFLFTDIEGSTRRWQQDPVAMAQAVARHLVLLREAVSTHGGVLFKVIGDGTQSAFVTAPAALAAALAAQRALSTEPWPAPLGELQVRMALHTGEAHPDLHGDYLAPALNRLARVLAAGHGGQLLVTQVTAELARSGLPPNTTLHDLGTHTLQDFDAPEPIFQLVDPDLPAAFPPLGTRSGPRYPLPVPATSFVGRAREGARLVLLLRSPAVRLITVTGPGGVGKTRLALEAATQVLSDFPDGVVFVDLAPVTDPRLVLSTIAAAFGLKEQAAQTLLEILIQEFRGQRLLLILDNCEQVLTAAPALAQVIAGTPGLVVLATSRARLALTAEQEFALAPMPIPNTASSPIVTQVAATESVQLFVSRARAYKPDFAVSDENAAAVAGICARLEGLPLAIELAAARIKLLPPAALLQRLERRLSVLTSGARDLPVRQQTIRNTIAWSFDLLSLEEQALFRRLAVFVGGWTFEAAEAVAALHDPLDVFTGLASLVDKSLVQQRELPDGNARFGMLEIVREFAVEQLVASGEEDAVRRAHAAYILGVAERMSDQLFVATEPALLDALDVEHDNARAALAWLEQIGEHETGLRLAVAFGWLWFVRGYYAEGRRWLDHAFSCAADIAPTIRARALMWASDIAFRQDDFTAAQAMASESVRLLRESGDTSVWLAASQINLAAALHQQGGDDAAASLLNDALAVVRSLENTLLTAVVLNNLAEIAVDQGDHGKAEGLLAEAVTLQAQLPSAWGTPHSQLLLAAMAYTRGDLGTALQHYQACLAAAWIHADQSFVYAGLLGIGIVAARLGAGEDAATIFGAAGRRPGLFRWEQTQLAAATKTVETQLGHAAFAARHGAGAALSLGDAVALAQTVAARMLRA